MNENEGKIEKEKIGDKQKVVKFEEEIKEVTIDPLPINQDKPDVNNSTIIMGNDRILDTSSIKPQLVISKKQTMLMDDDESIDLSGEYRI